MKAELLERIANFGKVDMDVSFKSLTTIRAGGIAKQVVYPYDILSLQGIIEICMDNNLEYKVFGNGSNILCSEEEYEGLIIKLNKGLNKVYFDNNTVIVEAGYSIIGLSIDCQKRGLSGLEFASGIPGTVGGTIFMNAGAYKSSMSEVVEEVEVLIDNKVVWLTNQQCEFGYRNSIFQKNPDWIILACKINLTPGSVESISALMKTRRDRRIESQPLEFPSAGSIFRNPTGEFAWKYIDMIGYRGKHYGDAWVSEKHSNFIVNKGKASSNEIMRLINEITTLVKENYGVDMITEVEKFNWKN